MLSPSEEEKLLVLPSSGMGSAQDQAQDQTFPVELQITLPPGWDSERTPCMSKVLWIRSICLGFMFCCVQDQCLDQTRPGSGLGRKVWEVQVGGAP